MTPRLELSINPSYLCNFRCGFCYLSETQLGDPRRLDLQRLESLLQQAHAEYRIEHVDLYGGEIAALPPAYAQELLEIVSCFYLGPVSVISNYSRDSPILHDPRVDLTISWDYLARERYEEVHERMRALERPFHMLTLASERVVTWNDEELKQYFALLAQLPELRTLEFKPYSSNPHHPQRVTHRDFENFMKRVLVHAEHSPIELVNETKIRRSLEHRATAWSDEHLYITPEGSFAVLEFDSQQREFFLPLASLAEYRAWSHREKLRVATNPFCSQCSYLGRCLSEHLQEITSLENSCNGFAGLLSWYEKREKQHAPLSIPDESFLGR